MKQAIVNFCKAMDTGLFLLDMPTGFGKTYSVLDFMVDNYDSPEFKDKKIFFVTTLKKNLPDKELREHFSRRGKADDYDKYCLRIEANADMVVEKLDELYRARKIPPAITMKQEFKDLHGSVKLLNEYRDKKRELKGTSRDIINVLCKSAEEAIRKQQEGAFRRVIENELKQFRTPKEKLKNIANNPDYHWIGELYPAVYTREKRIFFMSMDKFFLGNTTIIEPTYSFYNNDITKNAIIFIDEFDATRDRLLNQIITRGLENHIDYLGLFHRVYASLKTRDFPAELTTASELQQAYLDEHKNAKNPVEIIEGFGEVFDETYDRFAMQYSFKTEEDGKNDRSRNFIFNDLQFHSVFEGENAFIDIDTDLKARQNWLRFTKRRPTEKDGGVLSLLASVKGCLTYFQNGTRNLSFNYKHHKDEDKRPGDDDYTLENAIESVLTEFHLSREQIRYLKPIVMGGQVKSKKDKKDSNGKMSLKYFDRSVYDRGFRYYDFIDDPNHSMRSEIQLFDFQDSPERILLHLSEKAQIIGISATATLDTVIGNYDLEYLQRMLQDKFYVMPEADKCRFQEAFQTFVTNYDKVNIHVEPVCYSSDDKVELAEIFDGNEALIKKYTEKLSTTFERVEYAKNNFIRVVKVMKAFILNDSVKSFLCLNNKLPQENKGLFDIKLLEEFADAIIKLYGIKRLKGKDLLYSINSEDYDAKRAEFIQKLSKGEKLFVISSYNTVGAGQNLQYKASGNAAIVAVNDYDRGDMEKDFDCIYLEKPTNLLVNVDSKKGIEAEDLIRFVYQMEFLMERGEVSRKDGIAVIKDAFICFSGGYTFSGKKGEPYKTDSVNNFAIRTLIQAVGRICRTGLKNPDIYIYVDNTILSDYDLSVVEQRMLNPEFAELVKVGKTHFNGQANEDQDIAVMENRAGTLALKAMQIINELKRNWTDDSIDYWKALRELCLMRPTLSRKNVEHNSQYQLVYMCAPGEITAYSYEQEGDYNKNITIKFDGSLPQKMSEDEVHLKELMQIPGVKALFEEHGYATSFVPKALAKNRSEIEGNIYQEQYKDVYDNLTDELHSGAITSGGTTLEEVRATDENPVGYAKAFERKQMLGEMKASATNMAKASFVTTGIVSGVTNMFEVFKNEKDLADAFHDVGADAVKGAVRGGATGVISTAIRYQGVKTGSALLTDGLASTVMAGGLIDGGVALYAYAKGEIGHEELKEALIDTTAKATTTIYFTKAVTAIMGKSVSPIVPLAVYTTASYVFTATREIIKNANLNAEEYNRMAALLDESTRQINEYNQQLHNYLARCEVNQRRIMNEFLTSFNYNMETGENYDEAILAITKFAEQAGITLKYVKFDDFSAAMKNREVFMLE